MSTLEQVKLVIGMEDDCEDALLQLLIQRAEEIVQQFSRNPKAYEYLVVDAVVIAYNQRGAEGNESTSSSGISQSWAFNTMHDFIKSQLPARYVIK